MDCDQGGAQECIMLKAGRIIPVILAYLALLGGAIEYLKPASPSISSIVFTAPHTLP